MDNSGTQDDNRRMTAVRFIGPVEDRMDNLTDMLRFVRAEQPSQYKIYDWLKANTTLNEDSTLRKRVRFIKRIDFLRIRDGHYTLGPYGEAYLAAESKPGTVESDIVYAALTETVKGFECLLRAIANEPIADEQIPGILANEYPSYELPRSVGIKHYRWLEMIGYIERTDGEYRITEAGQEGLTGSTEMPTPDSEGDRERRPQRTPSELRAWEERIRGSPESREGTLSDRTVTYEHDVEKHLERTDAHEEALEALAKALESRGYTCHETDHTDQLAVADGRVILIEAKTITPATALTQIRTALGQLFEYAYYDVIQRDEWRDRTLVRCLYLASTPPSDLHSYLEHLSTQEIEVIWQENDRVAGPSWPDIV